MTTFLYVFGFETPQQSRGNVIYGWDDENSEAVLIDADDEASALLWGDEIAERFIKLLFRDDQVSWRDQQFARWIEPPTPEWTCQQHVSFGVFPDFTAWLPPYKDDMSQQ